MSSSSNKPYQSRLLNFFNRYYIKVHSQVNVKLRELGYVIQGGLQTAILPLLWLFQSGKRIGQVFSSQSPSVSALPDKNHQHNSSSNDSADSLITIVHQNITSNPLFSSLFPSQFQGLASNLNNKAIVVVLHKNKVKNLIAQNKQNNLKFIINKTLEKNQQLTRKSLSKNNHKLSSILSNNKWQKTDSKLINSVDIFLSQLEKLIVKKNAHNNSAADQKINQNISLQPSPNALSIIKNNELVQDIMATSHHKLQEVVPILKETTAKIAVKSVEQIQEVTRQLSKSREEDPFQIKILLAEAINYFFAQQQGKKLHSSLSNKLFQSLTNIKVVKIEQETNQPWLSWEDLYGTQKLLPTDNLSPISLLTEPKETLQDESQLTTSQLVNSLAINQKDNPVAPDEMLNIFKVVANSEKTTDALLTIPASEMVTTQSNCFNTVTKSDSNKIVKSKTSPQIITSEQEEAIETKVIEIKYEKHFLEIILEKLDQIILWLEEIFIKIANLIKVLISDLKNNQN